MAGVGANVLTLADRAKRLDPSGKIADIVELLSLNNEIIDDMHWEEGNLDTGHQITVRTGLPTVAWRLMNGGVAVSKSTTAQATEGCGMMEAWSEVDEDLANLGGNAAAVRLSEARAFVEAMNQEFASTLFYGNSSIDPEEFTGLSIRYSSTTANNGQNIISAGGAGSDNSSIWLIVWGPNSIFGIYPKGSMAGLKHSDLGVETVEVTAGVGSGTRMRAYRDRWQWKCGLALKDWRFAVRIPNIDISNLVGEASAADLFKLMIKATHRIPNLKAGRAAFYMNRDCFQMLDIQSRDAAIAGGGIKFENVEGRPQYSFRGIPVRIEDSLVENESVVS